MKKLTAESAKKSRKGHGENLCSFAVKP